MILLETILHSFAAFAILLFEYICVGILVFSGIQGILNYMRGDSLTRLTFGRGITTALEFLLGSAVLRTLTDPSLNTALTALVILAVLAGLSILLHFGKNETAADTTLPAAEQPEETAKSEESAESK